MGILPSKEFYQGYIGAQSDLTQVTTLKKKIWSSASELTRKKIEQLWIVKWQTVLRNSVCN